MWPNNKYHSSLFHRVRRFLLGRSSRDVVIFDMASMEPTAILQGHTDWLFGMSWLDKEHLVTASRDTTVQTQYHFPGNISHDPWWWQVRLWCPKRPGQGVPNTPRSACKAVGTCHTDKVRSVPCPSLYRESVADDLHGVQVRSLAVDCDRGQFVTLGEQGHLQSWDIASFQPKGKAIQPKSGHDCVTVSAFLWMGR